MDSLQGSWKQEVSQQIWCQVVHVAAACESDPVRHQLFMFDPNRASDPVL